MQMDYKLTKYGSVFSTRSKGARMLAELKATPEVVDFRGVRSVSYSWADEFVGKLYQRAHDRGAAVPAIANAEHAVLSVINFSLNNRGLKSKIVTHA